MDNLGRVDTCWCKIVKENDNKILFIFHSWISARESLLAMGFKDSVHKNDDGGDRWWYKNQKYSLLEY